MKEENVPEHLGPQRSDHEPPTAVAEWGWRYHHMGIPTDQQLSLIHI